jgi:hypothetical protein
MNGSKMTGTKDRRRISDILSDLTVGDENDIITINDIRQSLGDRAFGALMLVFALPNLVPVFIPGLSSVLAAPLILLSGQICLGYKHPWFPKSLHQRSFLRSDFARVIARVLPWLRKTERLLKPRMIVMVDYPLDRGIGFFCLALSILLALPIPLGNWLPALSISLFALAITERDGLASIIAFIIGISASAVASTVVYTLARGIWLGLHLSLSQ